MAKRKKPRILFEVKCPLGYSVSLGLICWTCHVLKYHPDMLGRESDVVATVTFPEEIRSNHKENRLNFVYWKTFKMSGKGLTNSLCGWQHQGK